MAERPLWTFAELAQATGGTLTGLDEGAARSANGVDFDSRALAPAYLAKAYLWAAAAKARPTDEREQARARLIEGQILAVMPASWRPDLDRKVAEHLARFSTQP